MNMFEMHEFFLDYYRKEEGPGTPVVTPTVESVKPQGAVDNMSASAASNPQAKPFPLKKVLITAGTIYLGYILLVALIPKNDISHTFSERRRLARQGATK